jgi:hypothetical protein
MPWKPAAPGEVPSLGWYVLDWIEENLAAPDRGEYEPFIPTREQAEFVLRYYELDPRTCRRVIRRGVLSRPRGWGKSPFLAALAIVEGLGDVVPDGWDAEGQPVGMPWSEIRTPLVQVAAASETQTKNSWTPLLEMLNPELDPPVFDNYPGLEPLGTFVNLPRGRIEPITSSATSAKGNKPVFAILDQTEEWTSTNGGTRLAATMRNNATKIGGSLIETPNAYTPGMKSVAEATAQAYRAMVEGRTKIDRGILYDHREAPGETNLSDARSLMAGIRYAYGDSSDHADGCVIHEPACAPGWSPVEGIMQSFWQLDNDPQVMRADFLNQVTHAADSWISQPEWSAVEDSTRRLVEGDTVTLGFDGAVRDDATALAVCRVSDGHLELVDCWEKDPRDPDWQVDRGAVHRAVAEAMERFTVVGFYCDPPYWQDAVDTWTEKFGRLMRVGIPARPLEWWTNRNPAMVAAIERFHSAVLNGDLSHRGEADRLSSILTTHVLNARTRESRSGFTIAKEHPKSDRKIDAAMAAVLAYECRADAVAKGFGQVRKRRVKAAAF